MTFAMFLEKLHELYTAAIGDKREYWHYSITKNSETEYMLFYRRRELAICKDIPSAIIALNASYHTIHIDLIHFDGIN